MSIVEPNDRLAQVSESTRRIVDWFESLQPQTLGTISGIYAFNAHFRDPFNDVCGTAAIRAVYEHMFETLEHPRFEVIESVAQGQQICLVWMFRFTWRAKSFEIEGSTLFDLDSDGLIARHRDYWDVAQGLYEHLPVLGPLLRLVRKKMATPRVQSS